MNTYQTREQNNASNIDLKLKGSLIDNAVVHCHCFKSNNGIDSLTMNYKEEK